MEHAVRKLGGWAEERWRLLLVVIAVAVIGGIGIRLAATSPLNGKFDQASLAASQRKLEIGRRFKAGVAKLQAKQYEDALTAFHEVLKMAPEMPEAHVNAGYALLGLGEFKAARDFFDTATNLNPNQLNAYFGLAEALVELGDDLGAMQAMETYVHLAPAKDPFRRKAESAAWELRAKLDEQKAKLAELAAQPASTPKSGEKP